MLISGNDHHRKDPHDTNPSTTPHELRDAALYADYHGVSAWINWLRSIRVADLLHKMQEIDYREENALKELQALTKSVEQLIASNRGGTKGIHGFIGERAQVFITNAWALIRGQEKVSELIDDNGMTDYLENGVAIQQKACRSGGFLGMDHMLRHKAKYPEFNGKYQMPKDFYEEYRRLEGLTQREAGHLSSHEWRQWLEIQQIKQAGIEIEPMQCTYDEIQKGAIYDTIDSRKHDINEEADAQRAETTASHRPTVQEGCKAAAASAAIEGMLSAGAEVFDKYSAGKHIRDYDKEDIKDVGKAALCGASKGALRGAAVYAATNLTEIPSTVAGAAVTVTIDSASAVRKCIKGEITKEECAFNIGRSVVVATAGSIGAKLGGSICPIRPLGEAVGGFIFSFAANKGYGWLSKHWKVIPPDPACPALCAA